MLHGAYLKPCRIIVPPRAGEQGDEIDLCAPPSCKNKTKRHNHTCAPGYRPHTSPLNLLFFVWRILSCASSMYTCWSGVTRGRGQPAVLSPDTTNHCKASVIALATPVTDERLPIRQRRGSFEPPPTGVGKGGLLRRGGLRVLIWFQLGAGH